jgi:PAS domain S-box-containing protein
MGTTMQGHRVGGRRRRLPARPASVPELRELATTWAAAAGMDEAQVAKVALVVTEAVTNAVLHAFVDREPGSVELVCEPGDGEAVFRVVDDGRGMAPRIDSPGLGLGLPTIGRLADHVDVGAGPEGGTEVRMAFALPHLGRVAARTDRLEAAYGRLADGVVVVDRTGQVVFANRAAVALLGAGTAEELVARAPGQTAAHLRMTLPDGRPVGVEDLPHRLLRDGHADATLLTQSVHRPSGRSLWVEIRASELDEDGLAALVLHDVTAAVEAERRARFLADASERLQEAALDLGATFEAIAGLAVPGLADWCALDVLDDEGVLRRVACAHPDAEMVRVGRELHDRWPPDPEDPNGPYAVVRSGVPRFWAQIPDEVLDALPDPEQRRRVRALGMRSAIVAPLQGRSTVVGVLTFVTSDSGRVLDEGLVELATDVARRAGLAVDDARRLAGQDR